MTKSAVEVFASNAENYSDICASAAAQIPVLIGVLGVSAGNVAISAACLFLRTHGISIASETDPHHEMCGHLDKLEARNLAPLETARILRAVEARHANLDPITYGELLELEKLIVKLGERISRREPVSGDRMIKVAERLAKAGDRAKVELPPAG